MKKIVPTGILIPTIDDGYGSYIAAPEVPIKSKLTIKELKEECKDRSLKISGTKKELIKRIEAHKETLRQLRQQELNIVKKYDVEKIAGMERQLEILRKEILIEYQTLSEQQNKCNGLDKKANEIRATIILLKKNI